MNPHRALAISLASVVATLTANAAFAQAAAQDPAGVSAALGVLNRVVGHTQRLIAAKNFTRLPHEDGEFKEGVEALESAIAHEPADLKRKVEPLIKQAEDRSHALAAAAGEGNPATLNAAHDALADSVRALIAAFPQSGPQPVPASPAAGAK
jgi:hypothetical protein